MDVDESKINWMLAIASLLAGIGIGALGHHLLNAGARRTQKLRRLLAERERELASLKSGVDDHFSELAGLAESLQRDSDTLMQHLEKGAERLNSLPHQTPGLAAPTADIEEATASPQLKAPRDYADGSGGTLSEEFGLKEDKELPQPPRY
jgi:uncharacterized membrane-anchored protein YhcB (DUF1043 family)